MHNTITMGFHSAILILALIVYLVRARALWRSRGWFPRGLYLLGGILLAAYTVHVQSLLFALGASAILLSRLVPAHGWRKQAGET